MFETTDKPGIEEQYQTAGNTSDLTVEADRRGAGDVMIAAGWSDSRVGMALLRLHSEWDGAEKPAKPTKDRIRDLVGTFQRGLPTDAAPAAGEKPKRLTHSKAHEYALAWYAHETAMLYGKLKALPDVREQLTVRAARWGMQDAAGRASATIRYWLDQSCSYCHGLKWQPIAGAPALSNKPCKHCGGSGTQPAPHAGDGKRLANYMDDCVSRAQSSIRRNLFNMRRARNKVVDTETGYVIIAAEDGRRR